MALLPSGWEERSDRRQYLSSWNHPKKAATHRLVSGFKLRHKTVGEDAYGGKPKLLGKL